METPLTEVGEDDQPLGVLDGQGLHEHRVDEAEDGGIRADAQGQGEHGNGRDAPVTTQGANGKAQCCQVWSSAGMVTIIRGKPARDRRSYLTAC